MAHRLLKPAWFSTDHRESPAPQTNAHHGQVAVIQNSCNLSSVTRLPNVLDMTIADPAGMGLPGHIQRSVVCFPGRLNGRQHSKYVGVVFR